jgi:hypothetical protein
MELYMLYDNHPNLLKVVTELQSEGWVFQIDNWQNGHNGNDEWIFQFKSPRMKEFVGEFSPEKTASSEFRLREAQIVAWEYRGNHDDSIHDQIQAVLTELFLKNPTKTKLPKTKIQIKL